ncbi:thiol-disulfide oxidoreductase DCC family protein [Tenacibaculum jejuense]|uniref:DUF393 domain-containing protein n=1 Tax=Tenacibaculum jejuense TaxID=584609 RepID=A0A238UC28_9FLAO|nr:hypothetical protein [Tenacibaculum jejuense]SNR16763.1 conserved membrane protein of unknown function [Tenacibaculum jejuense]
MKTLNQHTLLYDTDCPLCNLYTRAFIKAKMLDTEGRKSFEKITSKEKSFVDIKRAVNEIALIDRENKQVTYGIDSLLKVIGNSFPIVEKIGNFKPIKYGLSKLYSLISYNRKVIIPSDKKESEELECIPSFNVKYRLLFIVLGTLITSITLFQFSHIIQALPKASFIREIWLALGLIISQVVFVINKDSKTILNYVGNIITVSLMGCIGLFQLMLLNSMISFPQWLILFAFSGVVGFMFFEHKRRIKLLELPSYLSWTWIGYRVIILFFILNV